MSANADAKQMDLLFRRVAAYLGVTLSGYVLSGSFALSFLCLSFTRYKNPSPLYLLFLSAVLPALFRILLEQRAATLRKQKPPKKDAASYHATLPTQQKKEEADNLLFPLFCQKYHYSKLRYTAASISYLVLFFLLGAWHFSYVLHPVSSILVRRLPACIAAASLLVRLVATIGYWIYFSRNPLRAMR